jgi:hypothetical protein
MNKKLLAGIILSILLVYLSVKGIDFRRVEEGFKTVRYLYLIPFILMILAIQALRSWRWGVILAPLDKVSFSTLFSVSSVGFLAIVSIPARIGELARPYLIANRSHIKMTAALGTIFVERIFDSLTILMLAIMIPLFIPLPPWLIRSSILFLSITLVLLAAIVFMIIKRETSLRAIDPFLKKLPERYAVKITSLLHHFIDGFSVITDIKRLLVLTFISLIIWLTTVASIKLLFLTFSFTLSWTAALTLMVILLIGIAIPAAPGFVGNWHYACILGLGLFGIGKTEAFTFALIYHFISLAFTIIMGLTFLPFNKFSLSDLKKIG